MNTSTRFENAIRKLYEAFHNNTLHPEYCDRCAVGNICENNDAWQHLSDAHGSLKLNYVGLVNQKFGKRIAGFTPMELLQIEATFLKACGYQLPFTPNSIRPENPRDKHLQFDGLCAVVELLCEFDGIQNVMDTSQLFSFEKNNTSVNEDQLSIG